MLTRKPRTQLKKWLDRHGIEQQELAKKAKVSVNTLTKACRDSDYIPNPAVMKKLLHAIRTIDPTARMDDFWSM